MLFFDESRDKNVRFFSRELLLSVISCRIVSLSYCFFSYSLSSSRVYISTHLTCKMTKFEHFQKHINSLIWPTLKTSREINSKGNHK
jgi:hypothetical protein